MAKQRIGGTSSIALVYDGACPVCSAYTRALAIRRLDPNFELINAREDHPLVNEIRARGIDMDDGFVLRIGNEFHHGADAINRLALISGRANLFNRLNYWIFRSERLSRLLYPALRAGRNILLRLLGIGKLSAGSEPKP